MTHTSFLYPAPNSKTQARPHVVIDKGAHVLSDIYPYSRAHGPSSNLDSNVDDMNRLMIASLATPSVIFNQNGWSKLWTQGKDRIDLEGDDHVLPGTRIGLGWFSGPEFGKDVVMHPGQDDGFKAMLLLNTKQRSGVVMMTNSDGPEPGGHAAELYFGSTLSRSIFDQLQK